MANDRILYFSSQFPSMLNPYIGMFSLQRVLSLDKAGCKVQVICPTVVSPDWRNVLHPITAARHIGKVMKQSERSKIQGIQVIYPKCGWPPKSIIGWYISNWQYWQIRQVTKKLIHQFHPDAILSTWLPDGVAACQLGDVFGIPTLVIAEGSDVNLYPKQLRGWNYARQVINEKAAVLVYVSKALQDAGLSVGLNGRNNVVLHNAVDIHLFKPSNEKRKNEVFTVLGVGRYISTKGFHILLNAFAEFNHCYKQPARLVLIGEGQQREELIKLANDLDIRSSVELVDPIAQEKLVKHYQEADVFCLPSFSEGFPCVVVEAMACGKPVVASRVGGIAEVVDEQSGILVSPGDVIALREALFQAATRVWDEGMIRKKIVDGFGFEKWAETMIGLIDTAVKL